MATLPTQSHAAIVQQICAGVQGRASKLVNFAVGATLRAVADGFAGVILWFQAVVLQLLLTTRASTSTGADLDSFVADFGVTRLAGQAASGQLTYSRFTGSSSQPFIPVGATVQSSDGTQIVTVTADPLNAYYSASLNGYTMPSMATSIIVPAANAVVGAVGNVGANIFTNSTTSITGIDTVANAAAFANGADAESDTALRARFQLYILGLAKGNSYGLAYALKSTNVAMQYSLVELQTYGGAQELGFYYTVVDDGTGSPPSAFVAAADTASQAIRPLGIQAATFATVAVSANVAMTLATAPGYDHTAAIAAATTLITANINALGQGAGLQFGDLYVWAFSVSGVTGVSSVTLNSLTGDAATIAPNPQHTLRAGSISVS